MQSSGGLCGLWEGSDGVSDATGAIDNINVRIRRSSDVRCKLRGDFALFYQLLSLGEMRILHFEEKIKLGITKSKPVGTARKTHFFCQKAFPTAPRPFLMLCENL